MSRHIHHAITLCCLATLLFSSTMSPPQEECIEVIIDILDVDGDEVLTPYEAADAMLQLLKSADRDGSGAVDKSELIAALGAAAQERGSELGEMHAELDRDNDGRVQIDSEVPPPYRQFAKAADADGDGSLTLEEFAHVDVNGAAGGDSSEGALDVATEAQEVLEEFDQNEDQRLTAAEFSEVEPEVFAAIDRDGDSVVTLEELMVVIEREGNDSYEEAASFVVKGDRCMMNGVIGPSTPSRVLELVCEHPHVKVIEMHDVPGSMDDVSNLRAARMIRHHQLATHLPSNAVIASGGVDFFLAGAQRSIETGARLGVHSWSGGDHSGADLPREHAEHRMFLEFYEAIGIAKEFYWYTLEAASPEGIHWMTAEELTRFQMASPKIPLSVPAATGASTAVDKGIK